jgi:hypothetical protein
MSILSVLRHILNHYFGKKPKLPDPRRLVPRVRVLDNQVNQENAHWRELIGHEGIYLGSHYDERGEIWDVQIDGQPIPHSLVSRERFDLLPPIAEKAQEGV